MSSWYATFSFIFSMQVFLVLLFYLFCPFVVLFFVLFFSNGLSYSFYCMFISTEDTICPFFILQRLTGTFIRILFNIHIYLEKTNFFLLLLNILIHISLFVIFNLNFHMFLFIILYCYCRRRQWQPTLVLLSGSPMDRGAW